MIKEPSEDWLGYLDDRLNSLRQATPVAFAEMTPSMIPKQPGVYLISAIEGGQEEPYYVGRTKNLQQRLYGNHLMGPLTNARLKKYLIEAGRCTDPADAKEFIRSKCTARWIIEEDIRRRGALEGYFVGILFPRHGIYEEH